MSPNYATQAQSLPWVVYHVTSTDPTDVKDTTSLLDKVYLQVDVMHTTYRALVTTAAAVRAALDGYTGTISSETIQYIRFLDESDVYEEDPRVHRKVQSYEIRLVKT